MAELSRQELRRLARLGAEARLQELKQEEAVIRRAFPELFRPGRKVRDGGANSAGAPARRRRSRMSAAARRAVSERMTKYWAERRKAKAKPGK